MKMNTGRLITSLRACLMLAGFALALDLNQTQQSDEIDSQIMRLRKIQTESGVRLDNNPAFHDYLMENSRKQMPMRLESFHNNLNRNNMRRRLFYIYKWSVGRQEATRSGYVDWLEDMAEWYA